MSGLRPVQLFLEHKAYQLRMQSLIMTSLAGSGHPSSCLSAADLVAALFFYGMQYDPSNPDNPNNDRFILSKGHASPVLYAAWKEVGVLTSEDLTQYRKFDSVLEGHPTMRFSRTQAATGALGVGLSIGVGMVLAARLDDLTYRTYVLLGDGEVAEGAVWEAAELAHAYKLGNLVALLDCNRLGQSTESINGHHVQRYADKFAAFGWKTIVVDGHNMQQIMAALDKAREHTDLPTIIIAKTLKGYGVERMEDQQGFHGKPFRKEELNTIIAELEQRFAHAYAYAGTYEWQPCMPEAKNKHTVTYAMTKYAAPRHKFGTQMATRESYGHALAALGAVCDNIVSLDADVKNSTYAEIFESKFPQRFFQCYIAEQNMVGMAVGLDKCGKIPFVSTFGAFFSRAYDQIRMAAIGSASVRLVGSHAGVSIGQDGPSQMALEDIALMCALPNSIVLYPCDAVSTHALVGHMATYTQGISYLRTTRMATPVIYESTDDFPIGGCKVLKSSAQDIACVIAAGVTVFEALKAYEQLQAERIAIAVIDLYSIKPLDHETIKKVAQQAGNRIITVEDHYLQGGLGQVVTYAMRNHAFHITCLAVTQLPRSGTPEELMHWAGIDAQAITKAVKR